MRISPHRSTQFTSHALFLILLFLLILPSGCSEDDGPDNNPVTPNVTDPITMAAIPAGSFNMGNTTDHPRGGPNEKPVHQVTITQAFHMSVTEVTQAQYMSVMSNNPSKVLGDNRPVDYLTWYEAIEFCNRLSIKAGRDTCYTGLGIAETTVCDFSANGYRLPTEAEWEYACRAGTETDLNTGDILNPDCSPLDQSMNMAGWYCGNANDSSRVVGQKNANAFGLFDMHGNVWEMCWDAYEGSYYSASPATDPLGPADNGSRVVRGGNWFRYALFCRSAFRTSMLPHNRTDGLGFRIVRR